MSSEYGNDSDGCDGVLMDVRADPRAAGYIVAAMNKRTRWDVDPASFNRSQR